MNLNRGQLLLLSPHRRAQYWPLGPPVRRFVGSNAVAALVEGKPQIEFSDHRFATSDPAIAAGMVEDPNFDRPWGYKVDDSCIPAELREVWNEVSTDTKRGLLLVLISGGTVTEAIDSVDIITQKEVAPVGSGRPADLQLERRCPVRNCDLTLPPDADMSVLAQHIARVHPDWDGNA